MKTIHLPRSIIITIFITRRLIRKILSTHYLLQPKVPLRKRRAKRIEEIRMNVLLDTIILLENHQTMKIAQFNKKSNKSLSLKKRKWNKRPKFKKSQFRH